MESFDSKLNVQLVHASQVRRGMRLLVEVAKPVSPGGALEVCTELIPVWDITVTPNFWVARGKSWFLFRLMTGDEEGAMEDDLVPVDADLLPENQPPHVGTWITNQPFGFDLDQPYGAPPYEVYASCRVLETWVAEDGRVYRLLAHEGRYWVCRWDFGKKWIGLWQAPRERADAQWAAIVSGQGW